MTKEILSFHKEDFKIILEILGYKVENDESIIDSKGEEVVCPFTKEKVSLSRLSIMPGSLILMNTTPLTLSEYFYQYPDD